MADTAYPSFGLEGRVALVTGASRGIGRALALALAAAGADVVLGVREQSVGDELAQQITATGRRAHVELLDVTSRTRSRARSPVRCRALGRIDILVNNAGLGPENPAEDVTRGDFDLTCAVNLKGTFFVCQAVGRQMIRQGYGRIVNLGSQAGFVALPGESVYCMTKAAITHLTKCLAVEWGPHGITVNAVAPTFIVTPGHGAGPRRPGHQGRHLRAHRRAPSRRRPDGRRRRGRVPGVARGVADHRPHHPDRRRLDGALTAGSGFGELAAQAVAQLGEAARLVDDQAHEHARDDRRAWRARGSRRRPGSARRSTTARRSAAGG